ERSIEQTAFLEIQNQLRYRRVDLLLHHCRALVAVLMCVPEQKRDVFGRDFDVSGPAFDQPSGEQATLAEPTRIVRVEGRLGLEREVEGLRRRRSEEPVGGIERAEERLALKVAGVL